MLSIAFEEELVSTSNLKYLRKKPDSSVNFVFLGFFFLREMLSLSNGKGNNTDTDFLNPLYASYQEIAMKFSFWQVYTSLKYLIVSP